MRKFISINLILLNIFLISCSNKAILEEGDKNLKDIVVSASEEKSTSDKVVEDLLNLYLAQYIDSKSNVDKINEYEILETSIESEDNNVINAKAKFTISPYDFKEYKIYGNGKIMEDDKKILKIAYITIKKNLLEDKYKIVKVDYEKAIGK